VPEPVAVAKAKLEWIRLPDGQKESEVVDPDRTVEVQFNPETLKVTYANTVAGNDQSGGAAIQYVSKSSTKLAVDLWFDASSEPEVVDVRDRTRTVNFFFVPVEQGEGLAPPAVRFAWGSFLFEGVMTSMDETLDFFSTEGRPLRAKVSITITSQFLQFLSRDLGATSPGARRRTPAPTGTGLQQLLGRSGSPEGWQAVALANRIENPRRLAPGAFVDLDLREG
jgi:hypothetical protein